MFVKSLAFENYRNLKNTTIMPTESINVICGDNAQGKTNLLECLWLFTGGRSFRGSKDSELVAFGQNYSKISLCFNSNNRDQNIEINIKNGRRSAVLNDVPKSYVSHIIGVFCAVVFSPDHLTLIKNGPEERRNFIDGALCQIKPSYAAALSKYKRVLNERNALLKDIPRHRELKDTLDIWDERLAFEGALISYERAEYIKKLSNPAMQFYDGISDGKEQLLIEYKAGFKINQDMSRDELKAALLESLQKKQNDDIYAGFTTSGVHRDDLTIKINGYEAKNFGSQGQQRSAVLAMKLAEATVLGNEKGEKPVILLDDVLSELDPSRQDYLLNRLDGLQVFITCCEPSINAKNPIYIKNGEITALGEI